MIFLLSDIHPKAIHNSTTRFLKESLQDEHPHCKNTLKVLTTSQHMNLLREQRIYTTLQ
jgi:hypothetical protein